MQGTLSILAQATTVESNISVADATLGELWVGSLTGAISQPSLAEALFSGIRATVSV